MMSRLLRCAGLALALAGCVGQIRPTIGSALSSLPDEPEKREERLASATAGADVETRRASSAKIKKTETVAVSLAAFLGMLLSTTESALVGFVIPIDENWLVAPKPEVTPRRRAEETEPPREPAPP
jgi:hypothetical protein